MLPTKGNGFFSFFFWFEWEIMGKVTTTPTLVSHFVPQVRTIANRDIII